MSADHEVTLVDENDVPLGSVSKIEAHIHGRLHRAVSVFIVNSDGTILLQQRALQKYHSPGLWSNACCGHPLPNEAPIDAGLRRLRSELGVSADLSFAFHARYQTSFPNGLHENELVHVFFGRARGTVAPNPDEVMSTRTMTFEALLDDLRTRPDNYTYWLRHYLKVHMQQMLRAMGDVG